MAPSISVIVSTYNRPDALSAVLAGFAAQSGVEPSQWEVVVADDGSDARTADVVAAFKPQLGERLSHVWHEDKGFRLAEIRNKAARGAKNEYLVFLDGDCVPQRDFIACHQGLAESGWVVAGNRVLLAERFTRDYLAGRCKPVARWGRWTWLRLRAGKCVNNGLGWLRLALPAWRKKRRDDWKLLRGCNIGVWKSDYLAVDGFDAAFSGWGYEDSDFAVRLIRHGAGIKNGRFAVPVLHLWHKENDRSFEGENWKRFEASLHGSHVRAQEGLSGAGTENSN
ncbi:glycosyltransferase family 2 protein [Chromobacterium sp. IIBBL 290-4]|uniref:glycosyltransferase family 2 protein n=1 Tax=Chromobacterium sp. IIBBL 290-4 TaxID=2953890 RepID=UPI0020B6DBB3|nr:glycosyltransferase family 2 protein [Chromobacterium sp. IIBBL 290-4]UTH75286.1 glycosyltransferase family 2 protein [Chromobacterium sp. IIBBL 290-4]